MALRLLEAVVAGDAEQLQAAMSRRSVAAEELHDHVRALYASRVTALDAWELHDAIETTTCLIANRLLVLPTHAPLRQLMCACECAAMALVVADFLTLAELGRLWEPISQLVPLPVLRS